jgi:hypothetical protein
MALDTNFHMLQAGGGGAPSQPGKETLHLVTTEHALDVIQQFVAYVLLQ